MYVSSFSFIHFIQFEFFFVKISHCFCTKNIVAFLNWIQLILFKEEKTVKELRNKAHYSSFIHNV